MFPVQVVTYVPVNQRFSLTRFVSSPPCRLGQRERLRCQWRYRRRGLRCEHRLIRKGILSVKARHRAQEKVENLGCRVSICTRARGRTM